MIDNYQAQFRKMLRAFERCRDIYVIGDELGIWGSADEESQEGAKDAFTDFFVTCYHLKDWIRNDDTIEQAVRDSVEGYIDQSQSLSIAGDVANGQKHFKLSRSRFDLSTKMKVLPLLSGPLGSHPIGAVYKYVVDVEVQAQGEYMDAFRLAQECIEEWKAFLKSQTLSIPTIRNKEAVWEK